MKKLIIIAIGIAFLASCAPGLHSSPPVPPGASAPPPPPPHA